MVQYSDDHHIGFDINHLLILNDIYMKFPWFKRNGIFFIPSSKVGWIIFCGGVVYAVYSFIQIDSKSHSVSDTLINFVFRALFICAVYSLIAYITSRSANIKEEH
jgi:hypothetical protein